MMKKTIAGPSKAMLYFDSMPRPANIPTQIHAWPSSLSRDLERNHRHPAHAAHNGASGVIKKPTLKKNGNVIRNASTRQALVFPKKLSVNRYMQNAVTSQQSIAGRRMENSEFPRVRVLTAISQATIGG